MDDLEERIRSHSKAFEGLMSLIPADQYYHKDNSDQWQRKKQTNEQKRAAKKAKYDPAIQKSAKDVLHENERKRKRELGISDYDHDMTAEQADFDAQNPTFPNEAETSKKRKLRTENSEAESESRRRKLEKRTEKMQRKKEKKAKLRIKAEVKKARKHEQKGAGSVATNGWVDEQDENDTAQTKRQKGVVENEELDDVDFTGMDEVEEQSNVSASSSSAPNSLLSEASAKPSTASSISSIIPSIGPGASKANPSLTETSGSPTAHASHEDLQARLHARIDAFRAARKADGPDGRPAKNRAELLGERRRKEELRKAHKKELRKQAKEDEVRQKAEAELALLRGSGSPLSTPDIFSPRSPPQNNFSFGRVAFADGQQMDPQLSGLAMTKKRKGPQDTRGALQARQKKEVRLNGFDEAKKADIEQKDLWLSAKKRAHGERVSDNTSLLKKALKSKQKAKTKSEKEWDERIKGVKVGKEMRQKKREENLRKRREEKGAKGKKKGVKVRSRPGFEGSFKSRPKAGSKK